VVCDRRRAWKIIIVSVKRHLLLPSYNNNTSARDDNLIYYYNIMHIAYSVIKWYLYDIKHSTALYLGG